MFPRIEEDMMTRDELISQLARIPDNATILIRDRSKTYEFELAPTIEMSGGCACIELTETAEEIHRLMDLEGFGVAQ